MFLLWNEYLTPFKGVSFYLKFYTTKSNLFNRNKKGDRMTKNHGNETVTKPLFLFLPLMEILMTQNKFIKWYNL